MEASVGPFYLAMQCMGLVWHTRKDVICGCSHSFLYSTCLYLILWINFLRYILSYTANEVLGPCLVVKILVHFTYGLGAFSVTAYYPVSKNMKMLFQKWDRYREHTKSYRDMSLMTKRLKRRQWIALFTCIFCIALKVTIQLLNLHVLISTRTIIEVHFTRIIITDDVAWQWELLLIVLLAYNTAATVFITALIVIIALSLADEFKGLAGDLETFEGQSTVFWHRLEAARQGHWELCEVVQKADEIFSFYILVMYVFDIIICCLVFYMVLTMELSVAVLLQLTSTLLPSLLAFLAQLCVLTYAGTVLNCSAISCKRLLHSVNLSQYPLSVEQALQFNTFLSFLREGNIGLTAWKLFTINKLTIKMVVLMIVSYSVVLLRFGNNDVTKHDVMATQNVTSSPM